MPIISLSSNSLILVLAFLSACHTVPAEVKCPSYRAKHVLSSAVLFDGPPEEKADLMPDVSKGSADHAYSSWDVGYVFDDGRHLFLVCRFAGLSDSDNVTIQVDTKVERCIFRTHGKGSPAELTCK